MTTRWYTPILLRGSEPPQADSEVVYDSEPEREEDRKKNHQLRKYQVLQQDTRQDTSEHASPPLSSHTVIDISGIVRRLSLSLWSLDVLHVQMTLRLPRRHRFCLATRVAQ